MDGVDVKIVVQLWQVTLSAIAVGLTLLATGYTFAFVFQRKSDCKGLRNECVVANQTAMNEVRRDLKDLFVVVRNIEKDIGVLQGKSGLSKNS